MTRRTFKTSSSSTYRKPEAAPASLHRLSKRYASSNALYKKLDGYQQEVVDWTIKTKTVGVFAEQGTGKTWITGGVIEKLLSSTFQALIIVPLTNLETTWAKHFREELPQVTVCRSIEELLDAPCPRILLLHYEAAAPVNPKTRKKFVKQLKKLDWTLIAYDESQRLKDRNSLASRVASQLAGVAEYKLILSGTPFEQHPKDVWAQLRFAMPELFGTRWADFEEDFMEPLDDSINEKLQGARRGSWRFQRLLRQSIIMKSKRKFNEEMMPEFLRRISPYCRRLTKEVLNLKALTLYAEPVTLRGQQARIYNDIEQRQVSREVSRITAPLKVTVKVKLHQICGGWVFDDYGEIVHAGDAKLRRLMVLIGRHKKPFVVFCRYLPEVEAITNACKRRGLRTAFICGSNRKERSQIQRDFQAGKYDALVCQVRTGGVGIDLFRASVAYVYSTTYSYIDFDQALSRLHRRGQKQAVDIFLLYARNTVDEDLLAAVVSKRLFTQKLLNHLIARRKRYGESRKEVEDQVRAQVRRRNASERPGTRADQRARAAA